MTSRNYDYYNGRIIDPVSGYDLHCMASSAQVIQLYNRWSTWTGYFPEHIGRPTSGTKGRGNQGIHTARNIASVSNAMPILCRPCETLMLPCLLDSSYAVDGEIPQGSHSDMLLSQAARPLATQNQANTYFPGQCLSYYQPTYNTYPISVDTTLAIQKMWAFKGSVVNKNGRCVLLVNAGYGSSFVRDWHLPGVSAANTYPHTGYSADAFRLVHRPMKRK